MIDRRKCAEKGCDRWFVPRNVRHRYCPAHIRSKPIKPGHNERYGWPHRRLRAQVASQVRARAARCVRCGGPILPGEEWDLGPVDGAGSRAYSGREHVRCNRAKSGRNGRAQPERRRWWAHLEERVLQGWCRVRCVRSADSERPGMAVGGSWAGARAV